MSYSRQPLKTFDLLMTPGGQGIVGELSPDGVVTFVVEAGLGSALRGTQLFNIMMDSFGEDAKAIHGTWTKSVQRRPSANIDKVNDLTAAGMKLEEAIHHAWTVTRAKKRGFLKVTLIGTPQGVPGDYNKVEVRMEK